MILHCLPPLSSVSPLPCCCNEFQSLPCLPDAGERTAPPLTHRHQRHTPGILLFLETWTPVTKDPEEALEVQRSGNTLGLSCFLQFSIRFYRYLSK
jgi:hypothetical protein